MRHRGGPPATWRRQALQEAPRGPRAPLRAQSAAPGIGRGSSREARASRHATSTTRWPTAARETPSRGASLARHVVFSGLARAGPVPHARTPCGGGTMVSLSCSRTSAASARLRTIKASVGGAAPPLLLPLPPPARRLVPTGRAADPTGGDGAVQPACFRRADAGDRSRGRTLRTTAKPRFSFKFRIQLRFELRCHGRRQQLL